MLHDRTTHAVMVAAAAAAGLIEVLGGQVQPGPPPPPPDGDGPSESENFPADVPPANRPAMPILGSFCPATTLLFQWTNRWPQSAVAMRSCSCRTHSIVAADEDHFAHGRIGLIKSCILAISLSHVCLYCLYISSHQRASVSLDSVQPVSPSNQVRGPRYAATSLRQNTVVTRQRYGGIISTSAVPESILRTNGSVPD